MTEHKLLYPRLNPKERILKIVEKHIFPSLEKRGFKLSKLNLSMSRMVGDLKQEIKILTRYKKKGKEALVFDIAFQVSFPKYKRWHLKMFKKPPYNYILSRSLGSYILGWDSTLYKRGYDLAKHDNLPLIKLAKANILGPGLEAMNDNSNVQEFVTRTIDSQRRHGTYPALFDFAYMDRDYPLAKRIIVLFDLHMEMNKDVFSQTDYDVLFEIQERKRLLENCK